MRAVTREVLEAHAERFAKAIDRIESKKDVAVAHRARMAAKRLRYLLETLNGHPGAKSTVQRLMSFQELLGVVHDSHRIVTRLLREIVECAAHDARRSAHLALELSESEEDERPPFARVKPGLLSLARVARKRELQTFTLFRRHWRKRQVERLLGEISAIADSLEAVPRAD